MSRVHRKVKTPVGSLTLVAESKKLVAVVWDGEKLGQSKSGVGKLNLRDPLLKKAEKQILEYFNGERCTFDLPLEFNGTEFQKKVWKALQTIPYGQTCSYGEIAKQIRSPKSSRAVGGANNKNPLSIIIPCHRVIGANGSLVGFGGGLKAKEILLKLEQPQI